MLGTGKVSFILFFLKDGTAKGNLEAVMVRDAMPMGDVIS